MSVRDVLAKDEALQYLLDATEGEITPEVEQALMELEADTTAILERLYYARASEEANETFRKERAQANRALAQGHKRSVRRIEGYARLVMERRGVTKVDLTDGQICQGRWRVEKRASADVMALPPELRRAQKAPADEPNLTAIGKALAAGTPVPGFVRLKGLSFR